jgi:hypothetical protein
VSTLFPAILDLILIDGVTLLVRARAPPETWTTRLQPLGQPEPELLDQIFRLVTIFSNDCSKFKHFATRLEFSHSGLHSLRTVRLRQRQWEQKKSEKCRSFIALSDRFHQLA